jgi:hypothetical protein
MPCAVRRATRKLQAFLSFSSSVSLEVPAVRRASRHSASAVPRPPSGPCPRLCPSRLTTGHMADTACAPPRPSSTLRVPQRVTAAWPPRAPAPARKHRTCSIGHPMARKHRTCSIGHPMARKHRTCSMGHPMARKHRTCSMGHPMARKHRTCSIGHPMSRKHRTCGIGHPIWLESIEHAA